MNSAFNEIQIIMKVVLYGGLVPTDIIRYFEIFTIIQIKSKIYICSCYELEKRQQSWKLFLNQKINKIDTYKNEAIFPD